MSIFSTENSNGSKTSLFVARRPATLIPPIRLNIQNVEKALQAYCKRDSKRLQQSQTPNLTLNLMKSSNFQWLPLFNSSQQEKTSVNGSGLITDGRSDDKGDRVDQQPTRICLKRLQPISLFETSKHKIRKTSNDNMDIVLDMQEYRPLFQKSQTWRQMGSTTFSQEKDNSLETSSENLDQSSNEQQQQQQQQQVQQQQQQDTIDILEEVLGETDYNARSRIIIPLSKRKSIPPPSTITPSLSSSSIPSQPLPLDESSTSTKVTAATTTIETTAEVSFTQPSPSPLSPSNSSNPVTTGTIDSLLHKPTDSQLAANIYEIPRRNVPVFGTPLQYESVQQEISLLTSFSTSALKNRVGNVMDILNHPLIALLPGYTESGDSLWHGSGKTLLLQQLLSRLEQRSELFNLAIVCYDINMEEFLMGLIKPRYPVQRLNTVKKDEWDQEYGVIVKIQKGQPISLPKSTFSAKVDLAIIMDIRVQPNDSVMCMFENIASPGPPPIISLVTNRSVEVRIQDYISKISPSKWRLPDHVACKSILDTKDDTPVENSGLLTYMVVDSVIRWIDKGMKNDYQFANNQSGAQVDRGRQMSPSPRSTAEEHEQQNRMDTTELHTDEISSPARSTLPAELAKDKEVSGSTTLISLQDDLTKLFTHVSLERLQQDLKSYQTNQGKLSNQHYASKSDDEDSFYSAASDSLTDDSLSSKVQAVIDSLEGTSAGINETTQSSDMLKSMKLEFDRKCLGIFQSMVASYQKSVIELQNEYAAVAEKKLTLPSTSASTDSS